MDPRKSGPVRVYYERKTKFPFEATINGERAIVSRNAYGIQVEYPDSGGSDGSSEGLRL